MASCTGSWCWSGKPTSYEREIRRRKKNSALSPSPVFSLIRLRKAEATTGEIDWVLATPSRATEKPVRSTLVLAHQIQILPCVCSTKASADTPVLVVSTLMADKQSIGRESAQVSRQQSAFEAGERCLCHPSPPHPAVGHHASLGIYWTHMEL